MSVNGSQTSTEGGREGGEAFEQVRLPIYPEWAVFEETGVYRKAKNGVAINVTAKKAEPTERYKSIEAQSTTEFCDQTYFQTVNIGTHSSYSVFSRIDSGIDY